MGVSITLMNFHSNMHFMLWYKLKTLTQFYNTIFYFPVIIVKPRNYEKKSFKNNK